MCEGRWITAQAQGPAFLLPFVPPNYPVNGGMGSSAGDSTCTPPSAGIFVEAPGLILVPAFLCGFRRWLIPRLQIARGRVVPETYCNPASRSWKLNGRSAGRPVLPRGRVDHSPASVCTAAVLTLPERRAQCANHDASSPLAIRDSATREQPVRPLLAKVASNGAGPGLDGRALRLRHPRRPRRPG